MPHKNRETKKEEIELNYIKNKAKKHKKIIIMKSKKKNNQYNSSKRLSKRKNNSLFKCLQNNKKIYCRNTRKNGNQKNRLGNNNILRLISKKNK